MAYVEIVEQPASKSLRFRYECEGRSAGSIPGANSSADNRTFPTIQVRGYQGPAVVIVSCVTKDPPYRAHPHSVVGRDGCKNGVCSMNIPQDTMRVSFSNLGIQCMKRKSVKLALNIRRKFNIDPFNEGFDHISEPSSIDLNVVRLCFQVILMQGPDGKRVPLDPVVSEPIFDKKSMCDLAIVKMSDTSCYADGGDKDIILLCEKVNKEDIQIRFFQERDGNCVWERFGDFTPSQVHKQTAIWFRPPRFHNLNISDSVHAYVQLVRPSDAAFSEPVTFTYLPIREPMILSEKEKPIPKKVKIDADSCQNIFSNNFHSPQPYQMNIPPTDLSIKVEAGENSISPYGGEVVVAFDTNPHHSPISPASDRAYSPLANIPTILPEETWNILPTPLSHTVPPSPVPQNPPPLLPTTGHNGGVTNDLSGFSDVSLDSNIMDIGLHSDLKILNSKDLGDLEQLSESISNICLQ